MFTFAPPPPPQSMLLKLGPNIWKCVVTPILTEPPLRHILQVSSLNFELLLWQRNYNRYLAEFGSIEKWNVWIIQWFEKMLSWNLVWRLILDHWALTLIFIITRTHRKENHQRNWKPSTTAPDCLTTLPLFVFTWWKDFLKISGKCVGWESRSRGFQLYVEWITIVLCVELWNEV